MERGRLRVAPVAKLKSLEIQDLTVTRLRVAEVTVSDSLELPGSDDNPRIST